MEGVEGRTRTRTAGKVSFEKVTFGQRHKRWECVPWISGGRMLRQRKQPVQRPWDRTGPGMLKEQGGGLRSGGRERGKMACTLM